MASSKVTLKMKGLYTAYNRLGTVPEGSLIEAKNIVIDKDDVAEPRRGFKLFGSSVGSSPSHVVKQLMSYKSRLIRHYSTSANNGFLDIQDTPGSQTFNKLLGQKMIFAANTATPPAYSPNLTSSGTTATFVSESPHGLETGDTVVIAGATQAPYNGTFTITKINSTTFTYTMSTTTTSPATGYPCLVEGTARDILEPDVNTKIKYVEANGNLYFTTDKGIKKLDAYDATIVDAGVPRALDLEASLIDDEGFFIEDSQIGYRVIWGIKDANNNLILGAPSSRFFIVNNTTVRFINTFNATLVKLDADAGVADTNYAALYTLPATASITDIQTALNNLCTKLNADAGVVDTDYTSGTISDIKQAAEKFNIITNKLNNDTGVADTDYTEFNSTQAVSLTITVPEGITVNHFFQVFRTSVSTGVDVIPVQDYKLVYEGNPTYEQIYKSELLIEDLYPDLLRESSIELYTNTNQEGEGSANIQPPYATDIALYNNILFLSNTKTRHFLNVNLVGIDQLTPGTSEIKFKRNNTLLFTVKLGTTENINLTQAKVYTTGTPGQNLEDTAKSIVKVINKSAVNKYINAYYISTTDNTPGQMLFESININDDPFTVEGVDCFETDTYGNLISAFSPKLDTPAKSENEDKTNRYYFSKLQEYEAFPQLNFNSVGGGDNVIERISDLRDGLFIFSTGGIYRVVGDIPQALSQSAFDTTTKIVAPESLAKGNNQIFIFTDQGICTVSDSGVQVISRQIEDSILNLLDPEFTNFRKATFGLFYQSDRKYILLTVKETSDVNATIAYVYNTFTNTWVTWDISKVAGIVNPNDDRLYFSPADINYVEQERKDFTYTDHCDRQYSKNIVSTNRIITGITTGTNPLITCIGHGLQDGDIVKISNSNCLPSIDGNHVVTVLNSDTFTIEYTVTTAGTSGDIYVDNPERKQVLTLDSVNNIKVGDCIEQETTVTVNLNTYTAKYEAIVVAIDSVLGTVTINNNQKFKPGSATIYAHIPIKIRWIPQHAGDPSILKHFREAHIMFDKYRGYGFITDFSSDIQKNKETTRLTGEYVTNWGRFKWGNVPWGGDYLTQNFRTYIPLGKQKCRLLDVTFRSESAREKWRLEGIALFYRVIGERTNRS